MMVVAAAAVVAALEKELTDAPSLFTRFSFSPHPLHQYSLVNHRHHHLFRFQNLKLVRSLSFTDTAGSGRVFESLRCAAAINNLSSPLTAVLFPPSSSTSNEYGVVEDPNLLTNPITPCYNRRLVIAYDDATKFSGWQYQQSPPTVQCMVEKALTRATKLDRKELCLVAASRTDIGVHAWGQVAQFVTPSNYDSLDNIHAAFNGGGFSNFQFTHLLQRLSAMSL